MEVLSMALLGYTKMWNKSFKKDVPTEQVVGSLFIDKILNTLLAKFEHEIAIQKPLRKGQLNYVLGCAFSVKKEEARVLLPLLGLRRTNRGYVFETNGGGQRD